MVTFRCKSDIRVGTGAERIAQILSDLQLDLRRRTRQAPVRLRLSTRTPQVPFTCFESFGLGEAVALGPEGCLGAIGGADLREHARQVRLDRFLADLQLPRDVLVLKPLRDEREHLAFAW